MSITQRAINISNTVHPLVRDVTKSYILLENKTLNRLNNLQNQINELPSGGPTGPTGPDGVTGIGIAEAITETGTTGNLVMYNTGRFAETVITEGISYTYGTTSIDLLGPFSGSVSVPVRYEKFGKNVTLYFSALDNQVCTGVSQIFGTVTAPSDGTVLTPPIKFQKIINVYNNDGIQTGYATLNNTSGASLEIKLENNEDFGPTGECGIREFSLKYVVN